MVGLGVQCLRKQTHQTPINGIQTERQKLLTPNRPKHSALAALRDILCLSSGNFGKATSDFFGAPKVREQRREWLLEVTRLLDSLRANSKDSRFAARSRSPPRRSASGNARFSASLWTQLSAPGSQRPSGSVAERVSAAAGTESATGPPRPRGGRGAGPFTSASMQGAPRRSTAAPRPESHMRCQPSRAFLARGCEQRSGEVSKKQMPLSEGFERLRPGSSLADSARLLARCDARCHNDARQKLAEGSTKAPSLARSSWRGVAKPRGPAPCPSFSLPRCGTFRLPPSRKDALEVRKSICQGTRRAGAPALLHFACLRGSCGALLSQSFGRES